MKEFFVRNLKRSKPELWILIGPIVSFFVGVVTHFLYDWTGSSVVGAFCPVNESVWEHLKLAVFFPFLWWLLFFVAAHKKFDIDKNKWFYASFVSLITPIFVIPAIFYFYRGAFGVGILAIDIFSLFVGLLCGHLLGLRVYNHSKGMNFIIPLLLSVAILTFFVIFTFFTPQIPIFKCSIKGTYGI